MFIEPTITWVFSGLFGYIWLDTQILLKKHCWGSTLYKVVERDTGENDKCDCSVLLCLPFCVIFWMFVPMDCETRLKSLLRLSLAEIRNQCCIGTANLACCFLSLTSYKRNEKIKSNKTEFCKQNSTSRLIFESDLQGSSEVKNIFTIRKPIHDFLSNFYWHFLSISYRFRDIRLQSF